MKNSKLIVWHATGTLLSFSLGLVLTGLLSRVLTLEDYGLFRQIIFLYSTLLVFFTGGLLRSFNYFIKNPKQEGVWSVLRRLILYLYILGFLNSCFFYFGSDILAGLLGNEDLTIRLKYFSAVPLFLLPTLALDGVLTSLGNTKLFALYQFLTKSMTLVFVWVALSLGGDRLDNVIFAWVLASFVSLLIFEMLIWRSFPNKKGKNTVALGDIFNFIGPVFTASLFGIIFRSVDKFTISRVYGVEWFAIYSNGFLEIPFVTIIVGSMSSVLINAFLSSNIKSDSEFRGLWLRAWRSSAMLIYPVIIFVFVFADDIVLFIYGDKFVSSANYLRIFMLTNILDVILYFPIIVALKSLRFYSFIHGLVALLMIIFAFLIVELGLSMVYFALLFLLLNLVKSVFLIYHIMKKMKWTLSMAIPLSFSFKLVIGCSLTAYLTKYISLFYFGELGFGQLLFIGLIYSVLYVTFMYFIRIDYLAFIRQIFSRNV